jgi:hypothetical protein
VAPKIHILETPSIQFGGEGKDNTEVLRNHAQVLVTVASQLTTLATGMNDYMEHAERQQSKILDALEEMRKDFGTWSGEVKAATRELSGLSSDVDRLGSKVRGIEDRERDYLKHGVERSEDKERERKMDKRFFLAPVLQYIVGGVVVLFLIGFTGFISRVAENNTMSEQQIRNIVQETMKEVKGNVQVQPVK